MKRWIFFGVLLGILLSGCLQNSPLEKQSNNSIGSINENSQNNSSKVASVKIGDRVEVDYIGKLDGKIFDTSYPNIAKRESLPQSEIAPLRFVIGMHQIILGIEEATTGMRIGESKLILVPPEKGRGQRNASLIKIVPRRLFNNSANIQVGNILEKNGVPFANITEITADNVTLDYNHPLSGKTLEFNITVRKIERLKNVIGVRQTGVISA